MKAALSSHVPFPTLPPYPSPFSSSFIPSSCPLLFTSLLLFFLLYFSSFSPSCPPPPSLLSPYPVLTSFSFNSSSASHSSSLHLPPQEIIWLQMIAARRMGLSLLLSRLPWSLSVCHFPLYLRQIRLTLPGLWHTDAGIDGFHHGLQLGQLYTLNYSLPSPGPCLADQSSQCLYGVSFWACSWNSFMLQMTHRESDSTVARPLFPKCQAVVFELLLPLLVGVGH